MDCRDYQRMFGLPYKEDSQREVIYFEVYLEDNEDSEYFRGLKRASPEGIALRAAFEKALYTPKNPDDEVQVSHLEIPARRIVCPLCNGKGSHVNPSIDSHGLSREDFDDDPDFRENYFSGMYDVPCYRCHGKNVCLVVDEGRCNRSLLAYFYRQEAEERAYNAMCEAEMRFGC